MKLPSLKGLIQGGTTELVKSIGTAVDGIFTNKEEKLKAQAELEKIANDHIQAMTGKANEIEMAYLSDTQSAREENTKIQESTNASWLSKNVGYCIDIFLIVVFSIMLVVIINRVVPEQNKELFYTAFGLLGSYVGQCINYHRGTSAGSHAKQKSLDAVVRSHR